MVAAAQGTDRALDRGRTGTAGGGWQGRSVPARRTRNQNDYIHALIREAVKAGFADDHGQCLDFDDAKTVLVTAWCIYKGLESEIVIYDGRPIQLRRSTKTFDKTEASEFAEFIHASCAQRGIILKEPTP